jgi:hypothetical protein
MTEEESLKTNSQHVPAARPSQPAHHTPGRVLRRKCACGGSSGSVGECEACSNKKLRGQRLDAPEAETTTVPTVVHKVLGSPGQPLDAQTRALMEPRFGHDFSRVRVHQDALAGESARAVRSLAYTVGHHIVFDSGQYAPASPGHQFLLAHELAHVVQQRGVSGDTLQTLSLGHSDDAAEQEADSAAEVVVSGVAGKPSLTATDAHSVALRRFEARERGQITNINAVINTASSIAEQRGLAAMMRWGRFTAGAGGSGAIEAQAPSRGSTEPLPNRYLFTCRCGLVDMRHFYQLMYIAIVPFQGGNRGATAQGRQHELTAEATSRFAPEDSPSNALGAYFGSEQSMFERQSVFVNNLRTFLQRCGPVDFTTMSAADQDTVVNYYGSRNAAGAPANPNQTATPAILWVDACARGNIRAFPFVVDPTDPEHNTVIGVTP